MTKYYRYKDDRQEYILYEEISDGVILTSFDKDNGLAIVNSYLKFHVPTQEFERDYEGFEFQLSSTEQEKKVLKRTLLEILDTMYNYGIEEEACRILRDKGVATELVEDPTFDLEANVSEDEWFEIQECEMAFNFLSAMVPVLKTSFALLKKNTK